MGKASRKMKKKQQQEAEAGLQAEVKTTEQKLFRQIEEEAYSEALDTLVELVQKKSVSPQAMYAGAYAYFMMGDYDRAANWIDNTLRYAPNHVAARILLARLCILQDKADAGLAIFDLLTDKFLPAMKEEERDEIESLAGFYGRNESDKIKREYPHLAAFLQIDKENHEAEEKAEVRENAAESRVESVGGLKLPSISKETAPNGNGTADEAQKTQAQPSGKSALDVLRTLKAKIDARAHGNEAVKPSNPEAANGGMHAYHIKVTLQNTVLTRCAVNRDIREIEGVLRAPARKRKIILVNRTSLRHHFIIERLVRAHDIIGNGYPVLTVKHYDRTIVALFVHKGIDTRSGT